MTLDFTNIEERAAENIARKEAESKKAWDAWRKEESEKEARVNSILSAMSAKIDADHEKEMLEEIRAAKEKVEREIREKYFKEFGGKSWNYDDPKRGMLKDLGL